MDDITLTTDAAGLNTDDVIIGGMVRRLRRARSVNQTQIADLLSLPQSVVSRIENGERHLTVRELRLVCQLLNTSLLDFISEYLHRLPKNQAK